MKKIRVLASTTFGELLREKFFVVGIVVALLLVALSYLLGNLSFYEATRILFNLGTLAIELVTLGLSVFAGAILLHKEIEMRTCQIILTRPISRTQFLIGKWLGLLLFILAVLFGLGALVLVLGKDSFLKISFLWILLEIGLKSALIMTLVFLASVVLRPVLSALIGLSIYFLGHSVGDIKYFLNRGLKGEEQPFFVLLLEKCIPRFDLFNWKSFYFLEKGLLPEDIAAMNLHYLSWTLFFLTLATLTWRRRDIV